MSRSLLYISALLMIFGVCPLPLGAWEKTSFQDFQSLVQESLRNQSPSEAWETFESTSLLREINISDDILESAMASTSYSETGVNKTSESGFTIRPNYDESLARIEVARTILLSVSLEQYLQNINSAAATGSSLEDLVNFHVLANYAQNRPSSLPRHSKWSKIAGSQNPIYRLAAVDLFLHTWPDSVQKSESEKNEFTFEVLVGRKNQMQKFVNDPNLIVASKARESVEELEKSIDRMKDQFGFTDLEALKLDGPNVNSDEVSASNKQQPLALVPAKPQPESAPTITETPETEVEPASFLWLWIGAIVVIAGVVAFLVCQRQRT